MLNKAAEKFQASSLACFVAIIIKNAYKSLNTQKNNGIAQAYTQNRRNGALVFFLLNKQIYERWSERNS